MIRTDLRTAALGLAIFAMASCGGEEISDSTPAAGGAWIEVSLQAGGQPVRLPATAGGAVIESATFWVGEMRLVADHGSDDDRLRIRNMPLDLRAGTVVFRLPQAPPGLYSRLRLDLEGSDDDDEEDRNRQASLLITGKTAEGVPFSLRDNDKVELDLRAGDGVELAPGKDLTASVLLNLDGWLTGVTLTSMSKGGDRSDSLERLRDNIEKAATLAMRNGAPRSSLPAQ